MARSTLEQSFVSILTALVARTHLLQEAEVPMQQLISLKLDYVQDDYKR